MSLQKEGFRFLVCPSKIVGKWAHNAEAAHYIANGWTDCSGMTDE